MIKLVERMFMNKDIQVNKAINILSMAILTIFMVLMSEYTVLTLAIVPVLLAIFLVRNKAFDSIILFFVLAGLSYVFSFTKILYAEFLAVGLLGLVLFMTIKYDTKDINALLIIFIISAIFLNLGYLYLIRENAIDLNKLADDLIKMVENEGFDYPKEMLENSLRNIPTILSILGFIYSLIVLKTTRNYLNYKDSSIRDFSKINTLRITIKEVVYGLIIALVMILGAKSFGFDQALVQTNVISLGVSLVQINGLLTMDYVIEQRKSKAYRVFTWILVILLFSFLSLFFLFLGGIDIIFNLRGAVYARKK